MIMNAAICIITTYLCAWLCILCIQVAKEKKKNRIISTKFVHRPYHAMPCHAM